eukprot:UC4_evm2s1335
MSSAGSNPILAAIELALASASPPGSSPSAPFEHLQRLGDPDFTPEQLRELMLKLLKEKPISFLSRFGKGLSSEALGDLGNELKQGSPDNCWIWLGNTIKNTTAERIRAELDSCTRLVGVKNNSALPTPRQIRNRRLEYFKRHLGEGHFSTEAMRARDEELYLRLVEYQMSRTDWETQRKARLNSKNSWSESLARRVDCVIASYQRKGDWNESEDEDGGDFWESDSDEVDDDDDNEGDIAKARAARKHEKWTRIMQERFISGDDEKFGFDYDSIDGDEDLDLNRIADQDREEAYFLDT